MAALPPTLLLDTHVTAAGVRDDGWCLYASILASFGVDPTPEACWRLACTIASIMKGSLQTHPEIFTDAFTVVVDPAINVDNDYAIQQAAPGGPVRGIRTQIIEEDATRPYIADAAGNRFQFVSDIGSYIDALWTLRKNAAGEPDVTLGPILWPDVNLLSSTLQRLIPNVGFIFYKKTNADPADKNLNRYSHSIEEQVIQLPDPVPAPTSFFVILATDNHFDALIPVDTTFFPALPAWDDSTYKCALVGGTMAVTGPVAGATGATGPADPGLGATGATGPADPGLGATGPDGSNLPLPPQKPSRFPAWVPSSYFTPSEVNQICDPGALIKTPDCLARYVMNDIMIADEAKGYRLAKNPDSTLSDYKANVEAYEKETVPDKKGKLLDKIKNRYTDRQVFVELPSGNVQPYLVPNPYTSLADREKPETSFANPGATGPIGANSKVLAALAPPEMIADNAYAISLLESLWFCGTNPTLSNDPRCFPAKVLGELREYAAIKVQKRDADAAGAILKDKSWPIVKELTTFLRNAYKPSPTVHVGATGAYYAPDMGGTGPAAGVTGPIPGATGPDPGPIPGATGATGPVAPPVPPPRAPGAPPRRRIPLPVANIPIIPNRIGVPKGIPQVLPTPRLGMPVARR
jgi:hypothetical protein